MKKYILPGILLLLADILVCYLTLPVLSVHNIGFWFLLFINYVCIYLMIVVVKRKELKKALTIPNVILVLMVLFLIIGSLLSSTMVNAKAYRNILNVQTDDRSSLPDETEISSIPLMDTESSKILGNRKIGALNEIVSQFEVSDDYMTIAYRNEPVKVSALRYASFWKWAVNRSNGIPGYILVRPNDLTAEYVKLEKGMTIVPSGYFNEDIRRFIYLHYPTVFFESPHLELDENGKIYYVAPTYTYSIGLFGGKTITGCILVDPVERTIERYRSNEIPE
ncbi:MAG: hypothetical protein IIZ47_06970, partial [Erysipelotrichaceae bacterium]|nr:hypothetical protein [Erysipelotrichaceae bacterium]